MTDKPKVSRVEVYWHTVTYKTVAVWCVIGFLVVLGTIYLVYPDAYSGILRRISNAVGDGGKSGPIGGRQARFVNLDGKVQVKKVDSVQWATADYQMTLDKGDLIQTGSDGVARITFADGTTYTVKPDTLVTVEQNLITQNQPTQVGVHISSGAVDLATGTWEAPGSKAEVSFENAVASLKSNSKAAVTSDPKSDKHEITVTAGSAELDRGQQKVEIGQWQRVTFPTGGPLTKTDVLAPPELVSPLNLQPIIVPDPKQAAVHFEWKAVATATSYTLEVSKTAMFTQVLATKKTAGTSADITGMEAGDYFWTVTATDAKERTSQASDPYKFILATQGKGEEMLLEVDSTELHGNVVEISGRTEPGAALIVNGEQVADIGPDGRFHHFTQAMSRGSHTIVITGQNRRGGTAIKRVEIVIP